MKQESIDKLKQAVVSTYQRFGDDRACLVRGGRSYTGHEMAKEIEDETDFGLTFVESLLKLSIELIKRDKINVGCEDIDKRYDPYVDRYVTLNQFIAESYGGLPNESMLKEEWLKLPLTKPEGGVIINGISLKENDVIQLAEPELFKQHLLNERMLENKLKEEMENEAGYELSLAWFTSNGFYTHKLFNFLDLKEYTFRIVGFKHDSVQVAMISSFDDYDVRKYFNSFDFKNAKIVKMGCNNSPK